MLREGKYGDALTNREREVVSLIVEGLTGKEIATRLNVSPRTIEIHRYKCDGKDRREEHRRPCAD